RANGCSHATESVHVRHVHDSFVRCGDRGGFTQSAELRRGPGRLYVCNHLYDVGCVLPLRRMVGKAADANVLAQDVGLVTATRPSGFTRCCGECGNTHRITNLHRKTIAAAVVDAPTDLLGLSARHSHYVSVSVRLGAFSIGSEQSDGLRDLSLRISGWFIHN